MRGDKPDDEVSGSDTSSAPEPETTQMLHDGDPAPDPDVASTWYPFDNLAF
jgi:hypothetical protein